MKIFNRKLADTKEIIPLIHKDDRGIFFETFHKQKYKKDISIEDEFVQENYSVSSYGVLRGLHFQKKFPQGKLIKVTKGKIFDVAVDLRPNSKTFCQWDGIYLDDICHNQFWIPKGFAHGFISLSDVVEVEYKCTDIYHPEDEECLIWSDKKLDIKWPIQNPILSKKDLLGKSLDMITNNL